VAQIHTASPYVFVHLMDAVIISQFQGERRKLTVSIPKTWFRFSLMLVLALLILPAGVGRIFAQVGPEIELVELSRYRASGAEIAAYDPQTRRLILTGGSGGGQLQVLSLSNPYSPQLVDTLPVYSTSVAVSNGVAAVASPAGGGARPGNVIFIDMASLETLTSVTVGYKPDHVIFTPDGKKVLVANEGEPVGATDPEGSISIIDLSAGMAAASVNTAGFSTFNSQRAALVEAGVRLFPEAGSVAQDLEPEYIAVSPDGKQAWVTLQENNALAVVDVDHARVSAILPLGVKDWSLSGFDPSSKDGPGGGKAIKIGPWPVFGMYMPDSIVSFEAGGDLYLLTANEGDSRDEMVDVSTLELDPADFTDAPNLKAQANLGMLNVSGWEGDLDGDGKIDRLYAYGGRSFSIWTPQGELVYDSGSGIEEAIAALAPEWFNANQGNPGQWDVRSQDRGPEPEAAAVGVIGGRTYAFIGLEQAGGGVLVYDVTVPESPQFIQYARSNEDIATESIVFIPTGDSPSGEPLLVVANEGSGTLTLYAIKGGAAPVPTQIPPGGDSYRHFFPQLGS